jgi:hypothetical protein
LRFRARVGFVLFGWCCLGSRKVLTLIIIEEPPPESWQEGSVAKELDFLNNLAVDSLSDPDKPRSSLSSNDSESSDIKNALETLSRMEETFGSFGGDW